MHTLKDTLSYNLQHQLLASQYYPKPKKKTQQKSNEFETKTLKVIHHQDPKKADDMKLSFHTLPQ